MALSYGNAGNQSEHRKLDAICIMGPTASGKTALAMAMCDELPCDIISVDSTMVYRQMDIGSAKPDKELLRQYPHQLVDIRDPAIPYSAAEFRRDAFKCMREIVARGKIPLLVGGSMMYFRVLEQGLADLPAANAEIRQEILNIAEKKGWEGVHGMLSKVDPETASRLHPNDPQRIQRAMEVYMLSGKSLSDYHREQKSRSHEPACRLTNIAVMPADRKDLHKRIEERCRKMFDDGFVNEVRQLYSRGDLGLELPSIRSVGYRQVWQYLSGLMSEEDVLEKCVIATRQLAKRQVTWLRSWHEKLHWFESVSATLSKDETTHVVKKILHSLWENSKVTQG